MLYGRLTVNPVSAAWNTAATYHDYADAQRAVDWLSDEGFPVEQIDIVGAELSMVERVTGRLTKARAAMAGAVGGAWIGLLIGIVFGLLGTGHGWLVTLLAGAGLGAAWGGVFAFAAQLATRGQRDFSSLRALSAGRYDLVVRNGDAEQVRSMLGRAGLLPAGTR